MSEEQPRKHTITLGQAVLLGIGALAVAGVLLMTLFDQPEPAGDTNVVQAARDLQALTLIAADHLATAPIPAADAKDAITDTAKIVGLISTRPVARGGILRASDLLPLPADQWLLTVPVTATQELTIGERVILLGAAPDAESAALTIDDATVVALADGAALVAVAPDQARRAAPYLVSPPHLILVRRLQR